jgi:hypothetical protein
MYKKSLRVLLLLVTALLIQTSLESGCGSSGSNTDRSIGPTWDLGITARLPDGIGLGEGTTLIFSISIHPLQCTHANSNGVPVPDVVTFYPDGRQGALAPVVIDLEGAELLSGYTICQVTYTYPDSGTYIAEATAAYNGHTALSPGWSAHF